MEFLAHGQKYVKITYHLPTCPMCAPWNGVVVSLDEPDDIAPHTLAEAEASGLYHPNCLHSHSLWLPEFSAPAPNEPDIAGENETPKEMTRQRNPDKIRTTQGDKKGGEMSPERETEIKRDIRAGKYNLNVRQQVQNRHIAETKENAAYATRMQIRDPLLKPSILEVDASELISQYAGTGEIVAKRGNAYFVENIKADRIIGKIWAWESFSWSATQWFRIEYSSKGVHLYPICRR
jgi:hypothetical protein